MKMCKIDGCDREVGAKGARGMCSMHYKRWNLRGGDPAERLSESTDDLPKMKEKFDRKWILGNNGCWQWIGHKSISSVKYAYSRGTIKYKGRKEKAHRMSWILHRGQIPEGMHVLHKCDNSLCVNPEHLYLGDHQKNMSDMAERRRSAHLKLSAEQVRFIRSSTLGHRVLAKMFGVDKSSIQAVRWRTCHKFVT